MVEIVPISADQCRIETLLPRKTLLSRSAPYKTKLIAANLTQAAIITAVEPAFSNDLIARILIACNIQHIQPLIVLNKTDLLDQLQPAINQLKLFKDAGCPIVEISAVHSADAIKPYIEGQVTLFIGQSGMGKSTLLNALVPDANAVTGEISRALDSGRHTTTAATWFDVKEAPKPTAIIDSPGLQEFGLYNYTKAQIESAFLEFQPFLGRCRFDDCRHLNEPDCALQKAVKSGSISPDRLTIFHKVLSENAYRRYGDKSAR